MRNRSTSASLLALTFCFLVGCTKHSAVPAPSVSNCYSGTVVNFNCGNGYLIQVDAQYPIGKAIRLSASDSLPRPNIIAAINQLRPFGTNGQRIFFTYTNDPNQQYPTWPCNTQFVWPYLPIPHLVLNNVSDQPCAQPRQ